MDELQKAMAGPVEKQLGGETIVFAQLTFDMLAEFKRDAERKYKERRKAEIAEREQALDKIEGLSPYDRGKLGMEVYDSARPFDLIEAMYALEGSVEILTLSAKVHDSSMTPARMGKLLPLQQKMVEDLINEITPVGPVSPQEKRDNDVRAARGRLESAAADKDDKSCRAKLGDAIKMLYAVLDEQQPGDTSPPVGPASA